MHYLRNIIAALLALVIASPLCCCAAFAREANSPKSCCSPLVAKEKDGGKSQDKEPTACHCASKQPKDMAKAILLPSDLATLAAPPSTDILVTVTMPSEPEISRAIPHAGSDPPGALLVRYSRWLI